MPPDELLIAAPVSAPAQPATPPPEKTGDATASPTDKDEEKPPPRSLRTWLMMAGSVVLVLTLTLYLLRNAILGTPTPVYAATSGELVQTVVASGRVVSPQRITIALQSTGRVLRVAVAQGQTVQQGQLLIELDNSDSRASLAQCNRGASAGPTSATR
jgi:biotin carboxyl carrier protein